MPTLVEIVDYDQCWPAHFEQAARKLGALLGELALSIDHIGSTAVAGLAAKPLIDIDVTMSSPASIGMACEILVSAGYEPRGARHDDGVTAFLLRGAPGERVYLCPPGSKTHTDRLAFRDRLRRDPSIALAYGLLKKELASLFPLDGDRYTAAKSTFIDGIVQSHPILPVALTPELAVRDWQKSRYFYCNLIGFSIRYDRPEEGFTFLALDSAQLMINQIGIGRDFDIAMAPRQYPFGRGINLQIKVPTLDLILQRLANAGVALHLPLEEKWYRRDHREVGNRQFVVLDPDGYMLRLFEDLGERPCSG